MYIRTSRSFCRQCAVEFECVSAWVIVPRGNLYIHVRTRRIYVHYTSIMHTQHTHTLVPSVHIHVCVLYTHTRGTYIHTLHIQYVPQRVHVLRIYDNGPSAGPRARGHRASVPT